MKNRKLKPTHYLAEFYPESGFCTKTVINWIKSGKIRGEKTLTGRYLVLVDQPESTDNVSDTDNVNSLLQMMKAKRK